MSGTPGPWATGYVLPSAGLGSAATPPPAGLGAGSAAMMVAGAMVQAVGAFYAAKSRQYELRSAASTADFEASIARLNASAVERDAEATLQAGNRAVGQSGLRYAAMKASQRVATAAGGVVAGVGSAAEVQATTEFAKQADALEISAQAVREAESRRIQATDLRNRATLSRVSAENARRSARAINPWLAAGSSLLGSGSQVAPQWVAR